MNIRSSLAVSIALLAIAPLGPESRAAAFVNFNEFGTTVSGYQDDFEGTTLNPDWLEYNAGGGTSNFSLSGSGTLLMLPADQDPNKLLYNPATPYDATEQNVLALIRVTTDGPNADGSRGGVAAVSDINNGRGLNLHFRQPGQNGTDNHFNLLDDARAWGPSTEGVGTGNWVVGDYKWLRLVVDVNGLPSGKIWNAGTEPEPVDFNLVWSNPPQPPRSGLAGLVTNSINGASEFEVDYVLIQAAGLPSTQVIPEPSTMLASICGLSILGLVRRRRH